MPPQEASSLVHSIQGLMIAIFSNDLDAVTTLLNQGIGPDVSPNGSDLRSTQPLYLAITLRNLSMVELLLSYGANPKPVIYPGESYPLTIAVQHNDAPLLQYLLMKGCELPPSDQGFNLLHFAVVTDASDCLAVLLEHGLNPHIINPQTGENLLGVAAYHESYESFQYLVDAGVDLNYQDFQGLTPIMTALTQSDPLTQGSQRSITTLLDLKPDLDIRSHQGSTVWDLLTHEHCECYAPLFSEALARREATLLGGLTHNDRQEAVLTLKKSRL